ncbi:type IV pilin N-terminal domain-containing protein [Methanocalculus sp. MC3]
MRQRQYEAVSEVIGSILLISLVVLAVAIIGVGFLSQPPPVQTQDLNVIAGYNETSKVLYLQHDGGDLMAPGEYYILIDGGSPIYRGEWGIGGSLTFSDVLEEPERIQIISTRGGQQNLIREISIGQVTGGGVPITPGPAPISPEPPQPGGCDPQFVVDNFTERLQSDAIYFNRMSLGGQSSLGGFVNLTINSTGSYILTTTDPLKQVDLNFGDTLSIEFGKKSQPSADLFSVGSKGWTIEGYGTKIYRNGVELTGDLIDSWITSFKDYESSLTFTSKGNNLGHTRLIIKNHTIIDSTNSTTITLTNVKPAEPTLLVLKYPKQSNDKISFVGQADQVEVGNTVIYQNGILNI